MSLLDTLATLRPLDGGFAVTIPESWHQGRTTYGGFSAALALVGAQRLLSDLPPLRSAQISFVGPLSGEVAVRARLLRRGRNATWVSAEIVSEAGVGLCASFVFMGAVGGSTFSLNALPPPARLIPLSQAIRLPEDRGPSFLAQFERAFALEKTAEKRPGIDWWVRLKQREGLDPMVALLLIGDGLPPGVMPLMNAWSPVSSMTWQVNLLTPQPRTEDGWYLLQATGTYAAQGSSSQNMAIWNAAGEPVAAGMQSIAIFG